jgi:predicted Rossmann fold nucleotide-binding protein DprA/Smf involved in DNA uptake
MPEGTLQPAGGAAMSSEAAFHTLGNKELLELHKVAFLCSRNCPAAVVRRSLDWAISQREKGICVISGFHSRIEKEVLQHLLKGTQPIVVALAKGIAKGLDPQLQTPLAAGRLLIVSRYADSVTHACEDKCFHRNRLMLELADETVIAYASAGGNLERLCRECPGAKLSVL